MFEHVLCVYPYRKDLNKFKFIPPVGLECIARVIEPYAKALDIIDLRFESKRALDFLRPETDMACFSINWERQRDFVHGEIFFMPQDTFIVLGGRHATEDPEGWLNFCQNADVVVRGDGEEVMEDLCKGVPLEQISGISYRKGDQIIHNPVRSLGAINHKIYPNRSSRRYPYEVELKNISTGVKSDMVSASRGCPYNCTFCSLNLNPLGEKRIWSGRTPESVVDELAQIEAPLVAFSDDIFSHDMDRVERICDLILERGIRKKYVVQARLEIARRPEVIDKMELAGFSMLLLGIESAQDKTLRSMRKGFNTAMARKYLSVLRDRPMLLHGYFILGNIGESIEEMMQIESFAHELGLDTIVCSSLRHYPYSGLDELVAQNPDYHLAPDGKVYSDHCSLKGLKKIRRKIYQQFYNTRQVLHILNKSRRSGLLKLFFSQGSSNSARVIFSLLKVFVDGYRR